MNIKEILIEDHIFPMQLRTIYDPPQKLYCTGDLSILNTPMVAIVGARDCDEYGKKVAYNLGKLLGLNGVTTISGLAKGVDTYAHQGALSVKGKTIAVLGSAIDICYPKENISIYNEILQSGLIVSEYPVGSGIKKFYFPRRNRIISGLSKAVIVVQARVSSGSLITATTAMNQGIDVYSVPGNIDNNLSLGCNKLIEDGAIPLVKLNTVFDSFNELNILLKSSETELNVVENMVYKYVELKKETTYQEIYLDMAEKNVTINKAISSLEIKGLIETYMGNIVLK